MGVYYHLNVDFEAFKVKPFKDMLHLNLQLNLLWSGNFVDIKSHKPIKRSKEINQEKKNNKLSHQHFAQWIERHAKRIAGEEGKFIPRKIPVETIT